MSNIEDRYDLIIIGTGATGKKAVKTLKEEGKNAYLIDLKPETLLTLISQTFQGIQPKDPSSGQSETNSLEYTILLNKYTMQTMNGETTTYTLHAKPLNESESMQEEEYSSLEFESEEEDTEVLEAQQVKYSHPIQIYEKSPFLDKINEQTKKFYQKSPPLSPCDFHSYSHYELEKIKLEDDDMNLNETWSSSSNNRDFHHSQSYTQSNYSNEDVQANRSENFFEFSTQPPVYRERDLKLRKRLANSIRKEISKTTESSSQRNFESSEQSSVRVDPLGFRDLSSMVRNPMIKKYSETNYMDQKESSSKEKETETSTIETFTHRRRARSHKKAIYPSTIEPLAKKRKSLFKKPPTIVWDETPTVPETSSPSSSVTKSEEELEETPRPNASESPATTGNEHTTIKIDSPRESTQQETINQESTSETKNEETPKQRTIEVKEKVKENNLKRDDIELEDAYGGYSSWEEFLTPFSQNSRKRQEIDKIEKRKIALRGLHNLINNLG